MSQTAEPEAGLPSAGDLLDDLLHSLKLLQQPVYIHNLQYRSRRRCAFSGWRSGSEGFSRSSGVMERMMASVWAMAFSSICAPWSLLPRLPGIIPASWLQVAHIPDLLELVEIVRQGKAVFPQLFLQLFGLLFVIGLLCLFDEGRAYRPCPGSGWPCGRDGTARSYPAFRRYPQI